MNCYDHALPQLDVDVLYQSCLSGIKKNQDLRSCIFLSRFCHEVIHWVVLPRIKKCKKGTDESRLRNCDLRLRFIQIRKDFTQLCQLKKL